jgi:type I restriction enzyme M protein
MVDVEEIRKNDYDLSINKYKEIEYEEVEYPHPKEIIVKIQELENEIQQGIEELRKMVEG